MKQDDCLVITVRAEAHTAILLFSDQQEMTVLLAHTYAKEDKAHFVFIQMKMKTQSSKRL